MARKVQTQIMRAILILMLPCLTIMETLTTLPKEYKIGMIVQTECTTWHAMCIVGGAMNIAMDQLAEDQVADGVNFTQVQCIT